MTEDGEEMKESEGREEKEGRKGMFNKCRGTFLRKKRIPWITA